jgi:hypothetical protein
VKTDTTDHNEDASAAIRRLYWPTDLRTAKAARKHPIIIGGQAPQFAGYSTYAGTWDDRVIQPAAWHAQLRSSPDQIMSFFREGRYTQGLAMVVSWGGMGRTSNTIYGPKNSYGGRKTETIEQIERTLQDCAKSVQASQSIEDSWRKLFGMKDVRWSAVTASKALHFLCRSLGFERNPPVPIDGAVIRNKLWPAFRKSITSVPPPDDWQSNSFTAYSRYMTAISTWANQRNWTTTQMEATIFAHPYQF